MISCVLQWSFGRIESGEVPKRLKGLPWKGSRSLIAARGFKSLLLRCADYKLLCFFYALFRERTAGKRESVLRNERDKRKIKNLLTNTPKGDKIIFAVAERQQQGKTERELPVRTNCLRKLKKFLTNRTVYDKI